MSPAGLSPIALDPDEIMAISKADLDLDNYFYRCRISEGCWNYMGLLEARIGDMG